MDITSQLSRRIATMGFVCAVLIVLIHAMPHPSTDTWQWWVANLVGAEGLCRVAVPFFFFISGFFLSGHVHEDGWVRRELRKRVKTLVIPYFIWIVIGVLFSIAFWFIIQKSGRECGVPSPFYGPVSMWVANVLGINPFRNSGVLWYVRDLFVLVAISPALVFVLRRLGWWLLALLFAVYCGISVLLVGADKSWFNFFEYFFSVRGLCYFTAGLFFRHRLLAFHCGNLSMLLGGVLCLSKIALFRFGFEKSSVVADVLMVPLLGMGLFKILKCVRLPKWMTGNAFALYLMHSMFVKISIAFIVALGMRDMMDGSIAIWMARVLFASSLAIGFAVGLKKYLPRVAEVLFGGR